MAVGFPIVKLTGLVIKQVGKPLANFAKERAKNNHFFRTYICMPPAQLYHWCEVRMKMYVMNIGQPAKKAEIPKLNEQAAIELGANLLGEGLIFCIAVFALAFEYSRQKGNEKLKERDEQNFLLNLENKVNELTFTNEELDTKIRELSRLVYAQQSQTKIDDSKSTNKTQSKNIGIIASAIEDIQSKIKNN